jgi:hypothetical protein
MFKTNISHFSAHDKHQKRLAAGLRPHPLGELTALPQTPRPIQEGRFAAGEGEEGEEKEGEGEGREGEDRIQTRHLQLSKKATAFMLC